MVSKIDILSLKRFGYFFAVVVVIILIEDNILYNYFF